MTNTVGIFQMKLISKLWKLIGINRFFLIHFR